jgi:hypothetical protein
MSLSSVDQPGVVLYNQWQEAAVQVDSPTSLLKITVSVFSTLGDAGEEYFRQQAR